MKLIHSGAIPYHIYIVQSGCNAHITEFNRKRSIRTVKPGGVRLYPVVLLSCLKVILKDLLEQSEMIIKAYAVSGKSECCDRIKETCSQTSKSAVTKRRFGFFVFYARKRFAILRKDPVDLIIYPEVDQIVA